MSVVEKLAELREAGAEDADVLSYLKDKRDEIVAQEEDSRDLAELVCVLNELGDLFRKVGSYAESAQAFSDALETLEQFSGTMQSHECATLVTNIAGTYHDMGDFTRAADFYHTAYEIFSTLEEGETTYSYELACMLNNMALNYQDMGEIDQARRVAAQAYAVVSMSMPDSEEEATTLVNLATLAVLSDELDRAAEFANHAVDILCKLHSQTGSYPAALSLTATISFKRGERESALATFREAAGLLLEEGGESREYASILVSMSVVLDVLGRKDEADQMRTHADEVIARLG